MAGLQESKRVLVLFPHNEAVTIGLMKQTTLAYGDYPDDIPAGCLVFYKAVKWGPSGLLKAYRVPDLRVLPEDNRRCPFGHHVLIFSMNRFHTAYRPIFYM
jgi:hypothetical protein